MRARLVEQMVLNPPSSRMVGWRNYRIEYGWDGPDGLIWLPPDCPREIIEYIINKSGSGSVSE